MGLHQDKPRQKLAVIQYLRGIAVMLVMLIHAINIVDYRYVSGIENSSGWLASRFSLNDFGACGVDLFFVISGFVMAKIIDGHSHDNLFIFVRDRFFRIVPLYWLANGAYLAVLNGLGISLTERWFQTAVFIMPGLHYFTPMLVVGWSLAFELAFYSLVALVLLCPISDRRPVWLITVLLGMAIAGQLLRPLDGFIAIFFNPILIEFVLGIICYRMWSHYRLVNRLWPLVLIMVGASLLAATAFFGFDFPIALIRVIHGETGAQRSAVWGIPWALILLGSACLAKNATAGRKRSKLLKLIGDGSYSLYLVHMIPYTMMERMVPPRTISPDLLVIGAWGTALVLGLTFHVLIERPLLEYLSGVSWKSRSLTPPSPPAPSGPFR